MAKTHQPSGAPHTPHTGPQDKERLAAEALSTGQFRKARDLYKELCKADRPRFLGGLIEANRGLAIQMIQKGQCSEATQVLAYIKTIAPAGVLAGLELELALKNQHWPEALRAAVTLWKTSPSPEQRVLIADAIVLGAPPAEQTAAFPEPLAQETTLILGGFEDLSAGRFEALAAKLRPLGTNSAFAGWKTFLKGVAAFHSGLPEKARQLFGMLPEHGAATRAAQAYAFFIAGEKALAGASAQLQAQMLHGSLLLLGQSAHVAALERAETFWKAGKPKESYREMRALPTFPALDGGLAGALSDFYLMGSTLPEGARESFLLHLTDLLFEGPLKNDAEACCIARALIGASTRGYRGAHPKLLLEKFEKHYRLPFPEIQALLSVGYCAIAQTVVRAHSAAEEDGEDQETLANLKQFSLDFLNESIEKNPVNWEANFARVSLLRKFFDQNSKIQAATELCARFPREKKAFLLASEISLEIKPPDYQLAASFLRSALDLDERDPEVRQKLAFALIHSAAGSYARGELAKGRLEFQLLESHLLRQSHDIDRSREYAIVRQGVLENLFGDPKKGAAFLEEALSLTPCKPVVWLLQQACTRIWARKTSRSKDLLDKISAHPLHSAVERSRLLALLLGIQSWPLQHHWAGWFDEERAVGACLKPLAEADFSEAEGASVLLQLFENRLLEPLTKALAKTGAKQVPGRILFQVAKYSLTTRDNPRFQNLKLERFRTKALAAGDKEALKFISVQTKRLDEMSFLSYAWPEDPPAPPKPKTKKKTAPSSTGKKAPKTKAKKPSPKAAKTPAQLDLL
jgi:hypothetical protein